MKVVHCLPLTVFAVLSHRCGVTCASETDGARREERRLQAGKGGSAPTMQKRSKSTKSSGSSKAIKGSSTTSSQACIALFEWVDYAGTLNGREYTGPAITGQIGTFGSPLFDNINLQGDPVAALNGNYILNTGNGYATGTQILSFLNEGDFLASQYGLTLRGTSNGMEDVIIPTGGTGRWINTEGTTWVTETASGEFERPLIVKHTICS